MKTKPRHCERPEGVKFATKLGGIRPDESRRIFGGQSAFKTRLLRRFTPRKDGKKLRIE